jgi:hypothetical protein
VLVERDLHERRSGIRDKDITLLIIGELEQLLAEVIAEGILNMVS